MALFKSVEAVRILFLSGLTVLLLSVLLMASCRCIPARGPLAAIRGARWFRGLFSRHCVLWTVFVVILAVHAVFAVGFLGLPF